MTYVHIKGNGIYVTMDMPEVPRKGDILWLSSLTRGACSVLEAQVDRVEWSMNQMTGHIEVWLHVRITKPSPELKP